MASFINKVNPRLTKRPLVFNGRLAYHGLTHWGRVTHICVSKLTVIGSDNALSPDRRQAIIWTNAGILLIGPLGTNFNEILIEIKTFSLTNLHLKVSSAKVGAILSRPQCVNFINKRGHWRPGGRLNKKDGLTRYGDSHVKDKTS